MRGARIGVKEPTAVALEIIGITHDAQDHDLRVKPERRFYVPYLQPIDGITTMNFEIRAAPGGRCRCSSRSETPRATSTPGSPSRA
jgi:hypothetical protein